MRLSLRSADPRAAIPLTLIGGPAGAGKSAVIQHVLHAQDARRLLAVVRHVVDDTDDDGRHTHSDDSRLEWTDGAVSFESHDPTDALMRLARLDRRPDHVIVEADSSESPQRLGGFAYMPGFRPDGVVTVMDASFARDATLGQSLSLAALDQLRRADLVVLNKVDLAGQRLATASQHALARLAPSARFLWSENGRIAAPLLLGSAGDQVSANETRVTAEWRADYLPVATRAGTSRIGEYCRTWCLVSEQGVDSREFRSWVARLPEIVVRGSGVVCLREEPQHRHEFSLIGGRWVLARGAPWGTTPPSTRLTMVTLGGEMRHVRAEAGSADQVGWMSTLGAGDIEPGLSQTQ